MTAKPVRLSLDVSPELNEVLDGMALKICSSKSDVLRKSIALMEIALKEKEKGHALGVIGEGEIIKEIVGI